MVSLAALRWLADQNAAFVMLERDGKVHVGTGPVHSSDARLRRAQALALTNGTALKISRDLISAKLEGQSLAVDAPHGLEDRLGAGAVRTVRIGQLASDVDLCRLYPL